MIDMLVAVGYSPVAEAEQTVRLAEAARLVGELPYRWLEIGLRRAPAAAAARHLDGAADVLAREGWTQNQMRARDGGVCLAKALMRAAELGHGDHPDRPGMDFRATTYYVAGRYLDVMVLARTGSPKWYLGWNDAPGRTAVEVLELVRDAAEFARVHGPR
ncbi:hypothetical protein ACFC09_36140 [Streptomyces sp. NPDC056161]|uniref:DUF6197 family protein n=1 Tax=Streptomyces sp. NPDC056161 TaxID=3345732 RepID=UPI0035D80118